MKYFAYGSNMSFPRLQFRIPSAQRIGVATLVEHSLRFHKVSLNDGSAKCDAFYTGNPKDCVVGSLFEISRNDKKTLDKIEGLGFGYSDKNIIVKGAHSILFEAVTYYATLTDPSLLPYSWYLHHVTYGAKETGVPPMYLKTLEATKTLKDPNEERDKKERAIYR